MYVSHFTYVLRVIFTVIQIVPLKIIKLFVFIQGASRETDVFKINITPLIFGVEFI